MTNRLKFSAFLAFLALLPTSAAMAECQVDPNSGFHWSKDQVGAPHYIQVDEGLCHLTLYNTKYPTFRIVGMWIDQEPKHGRLEAKLPIPSPANAFVYTPDPGFKGDDIAIVHFDTEVNGQPSYPRRAKWRITVQ